MVRGAVGECSLEIPRELDAGCLLIRPEDVLLRVLEVLEAGAGILARGVRSSIRSASLARAASCFRVARKPDCFVGDVDRLVSSQGLFGNLGLRCEVALEGWEKLRPVDSEDIDRGGKLLGDESNASDFCNNGGEVWRRGNLGGGAGRGLRNFISGSIVRNSELVELTLPFRSRPTPLLKWYGTWRTLTSCPGSKGHEVVDGSAELWNSISSSKRYCRLQKVSCYYHGRTKRFTHVIPIRASHLQSALSGGSGASRVSIAYDILETMAATPVLFANAGISLHWVRL